MCSKPETYESLVRIAHVPKKHVLTDVLLETLSIIAYKQPVTKMEIEHIRGGKVFAAVKRCEHLSFLTGKWRFPGIKIGKARQKTETAHNCLLYYPWRNSHSLQAS